MVKAFAPDALQVNMLQLLEAVAVQLVPLGITWTSKMLRSAFLAQQGRPQI